MASNLHLPPGFRFHPTDEELVMHYLVRKCASQPIAVPIIAEINLYKYDSWELPGKALYGEKEWYFFTPRDRKYPNGSRPSRAAGSGYWKATGADKPIGHPKPVGIKKALVFYSGKAPKGDKTNWIMHEYRLAGVDRSARKNSLKLDDWVLCRIYNKGATVKQRPPPSRTADSAMDADEYEDRKPDRRVITGSGTSDLMHFGPADSVPRLHTDSSCSEQVVSPELTPEVQSEPKWKSEWDSVFDFGGGSYLDAVDSQVSSGVMSPLQDIFMYLHKPF